MSRALVYRYVDAAVVLRHLRDFDQQPCREGLCRTLESRAKNGDDVRTLWAAVLSNARNDHEAVTSTMIKSVWRMWLQGGERKFHRMVMAMHDVIKHKHYKPLSLEAYFREKWNMSTAQVYRLVDAASVLRQLEDFQVLPTRERACPSLKEHAKTPFVMRQLWAAVLARVNNDSAAVTTTITDSVWVELVQQGLVLVSAESPAGVTLAEAEIDIAAGLA
ncbi:hypothetical protein DFS34DRAFT_691542 [Phlyctochytrium arcticum]|nr:hypothetical protein DFS34DRAFT_691542 [Phlyctochytrium arcticum]